MIYTEKVAVFSEIRKKHSTQSEHHVEFLNAIPTELPGPRLKHVEAANS
jgi:hypothetical protein